jgi:hypothetical protein
MQRLEAKNPPDRPLFTAETRNAQNRQQDPRRNGLFSIDDGFRGSRRLNGGVRSQIRTGLHWQFPGNREIYREFRDFAAFGGRFLVKSRCAAATFRTIPYAN